MNAIKGLTIVIAAMFLAGAPAAAHAATTPSAASTPVAHTVIIDDTPWG